MDVEQPAGPSVEKRQSCPQCSEQIVVGALVCRFCGTALHPQTGQSVDRPPEPTWPEPGGPPSGFAVASLVLGVSSLAVVCCCGPLSIPLSILGVIFGVMGLKTAQRPLAVAGLVISLLGLLGSGAMLILGLLPHLLQGLGGF